MMDLSVDNIIVKSWRMSGTNCAPLLVDLFPNRYKIDLLDRPIRNGHKRLTRSFNLCYRYIDRRLDHFQQENVHRLCQRDLSI